MLILISKNHICEKSQYASELFWLVMSCHPLIPQVKFQFHTACMTVSTLTQQNNDKHGYHVKIQKQLQTKLCHRVAQTPYAAINFQSVCCLCWVPDTPVSKISAYSHSICKLDRDVGSKYLHLKYENSSQGQRLKNLITSKVYDNAFISSFINLWSV